MDLVLSLCAVLLASSAVAVDATTIQAGDSDTDLQLLQAQVKMLLKHDDAHQKMLVEQRLIIQKQQEMMERQDLEINKLKSQVSAMQDQLGSPVAGNGTSARSSKQGNGRPRKGIRQTHDVTSPSFRQAAPTEAVVFTAVKTQIQEHIGINQNIVFDHVEINEGNGYHADHGLFIAPVSGIYMFTCTLLRPPSPKYLHALIVHSGREVVRVHASAGSTWDQGSHTVFIQVNAGEEVWITNADYDNEVVFGSNYSSFSGYLMYPL